MSALVIRNRLFSRRLPRRVLVVNLALFAALVLVLSSGLFGGTYGIGFGDVVASLTGQADEVTWMVVTQNRLPRLLTALGVGIAFGLAGEMVQTLLRNPLASPDVIGFSAGAGLGAVITVAATGTTAFVLSGALMGGAVTALFLLALTWRRDLSPGMLVLMGIGLGVTLGVVTDLLMTRLDANNVGELVKWIVGSLSARSWSDVGLIWVGLAVIAPICVWHQFALARVSLPDEVARGLGLGLLKARLVTLILAVVLVGLAVAAAGPLPFVAFVAGPIAHGLSGVPRPTLFPAAMVGGLVTLLADRAAQALPGFLVLPAGIFTALIGAPVQIWVLIHQTKRRLQ
mgnify:CR=1 FL=1